MSCQWCKPGYLCRWHNGSNGAVASPKKGSKPPMPGPDNAAILAAEYAAEARTRSSDPVPSQEAAAQLNESGVMSERAQSILSALRQAPDGLTARAVARILGVEPQNISSIFSQLELKGYIRRDGKRMEETGFKQTVWVVR